MDEKPGWADALGYLIAAMILLPLGMWLKQQDYIADWIRATFY
jgi:hypothetical protein